MFNTALFQQLFIGLAILTSTGTMVQETKLNRAVALSEPLANISAAMSSHLEGLNEVASAHTHVEHASVAHEFAPGLTRVQARNDHRRYALERNQSRSDELGGNGVIWPSV
jgi:hypothetical protein